MKEMVEGDLELLKLGNNLELETLLLKISR